MKFLFIRSRLTEKKPDIFRKITHPFTLLGVTMKKKLAITIFFIFLAVLGSVTASFSEITDEFRKTIPLSPGTPVTVENVNGKVMISTSDQTTADIRAIKRTRGSKSDLDRVVIEVTSGNTLEIKTVQPQNQGSDGSFFSLFSNAFRRHPTVTVDYTIVLPKTAVLGKVRTTNGNIELRETYGNTTASSTNGAIIVENAVGIAEGCTTNGNVLLRSTKGNTSVRTTNGSVSVENAEGEISARSTNGNISLNGVSSIKEAHTTNGAIKVGIGKNVETDMNLGTTNGSIAISFPKTINADVEISTSNGKITAPDGMTMTVETISSKRLIARLGAGGSKIRASTVNGSIVLNKQ
jgi:hypothetical protein